MRQYAVPFGMPDAAANGPANPPPKDIAAAPSTENVEPRVIGPVRQRQGKRRMKKMVTDRPTEN